ELFAANPWRFKMWHVKDMDKENQSLNSEIGSGSIDFKTFFKQRKISGMMYFFVEQENNYIPNAIDSIKTSYDFISKNLI
ncbi:MAG: sugar phosphate isomerase/epimerase, partial [Algoriella sp.]